MLRPTLSLAEVPLRIISSNEEAPHAYVVGQRVELWCQLSRPAAPVHWYKDGEEVEVGESLVLEQEGPQCKLVLPCAQTQDTGEFVCDAGGDSAFYTITVAGECDAGGLVESQGAFFASAGCHNTGVGVSIAVTCCDGILVRHAFARCSPAVWLAAQLGSLWDSDQLPEGTARPACLKH